jgi:3-oxoacyl-[acyl-carrier protein] reductase
VADRQLEGRVALVTGAAKGIGAGIAVRFAQAGARVAVLDLDAAACAETVSAVEAAGSKAIALGVDVSDEVAVEKATDDIVQQFGQLDIAVNNAGVTRDNLLFKLSREDWDVVLRVHLGGAFAVSKAAQRHMVPARYGRIINLSSVSALGNRGQANYSAAKMGIQGFTRTLALELGPFGITANAIAPGYIDTDMTRATAERLGVPLEERLAAMAKTTPVRRIGYPSDIANAALFFAQEPSGFVTGQTLYVDGGRKL